MKAEIPEPATPADTAFLRQLNAKEQEWRTSGFPWRALMSRRELELLTEADRNSFGRNMTFYLANSERAQQLFSLADTAFFAGLILTGFVLFVAAAILTGIFSSFGALLAIIFSGAGLAWMLLALLLGLILWSIVDKPYGVSPLQVGLLVLYGPFRPKILDFEDLERQKAQREQAKGG